jgi:putative ABC transport system permease protein
MIGRSGNYRMAIESIRSNRWRSLLTMLGIVIGIVSVVTTVSIGEGAKRSIVGQVHKAGEAVIAIRPGEPTHNTNDSLKATNVFRNTYAGALTETDYETIKKTAGVELAVPFSYTTSAVGRGETTFNGLVVGTNEGLPTVLGQEMLYGSFFTDSESQDNGAVIGQTVAERLFGENVPIGKSFTVRGKQFIVRGIFEEFEVNPLAPVTDYNTAVFIPYRTSKELTGSGGMYQVLVKADDKKRVAAIAGGIDSSLRAAHGGVQDFSVMKQADRLKDTDSILTLMTGFVAGIAAISLIVGGIGILNIMLVSVTERTHEIGIRKAVGATNRQIMSQFLTEAVILSISGGVIGVLGAVLANYLLRIFTNLAPIMTLPIVLLAFSTSVIVGVVFGVTPALTAARKRPIDALRYE